jgi:hypothetical protein
MASNECVMSHTLMYQIQTVEIPNDIHFEKRYSFFKL